MIRECIVPRSGYVFAQADYPQLELYTLAQACVDYTGKSKLGEALVAGMDPHLALAGELCEISYARALAEKKSEQVSSMRKLAKVANFGLPGGLGLPRLREFAKRGYDVDLSETGAQNLRNAWYARWPEMRAFFNYVNCSGGSYVLPRSLRRRAECTYSAGANTLFQGPGSDIAKRAWWLIAKECYADRCSALFGSRVVVMVHDEFILETEDSPLAHDAAIRLAQVMANAANEFLPDVPMQVEKFEPLLMRIWSKEALPVFDESGRLTPWQP